MESWKLKCEGLISKVTKTDWPRVVNYRVISRLIIIGFKLVYVVIMSLCVSLVEVNWDVEIDLQMWPPSGHHPRQDCEGEPFTVHYLVG